MKIADVTNNNMFWGVTLEGGKRYAQTVQTSFHISMAALEPQHGKAAQGNEGKHTSVMINHDKAEFLLCTLTHGRLYQQPLDLNFTEGEEVTFFLNGPGIVHLTGYLTPEEPLGDEAEFSDDEADSDYVEEEEATSSEEDSSEEEEESEEEDSEEEAPKLKPIQFNMDSSMESSPEKSATKRKKGQKKDVKGKKKKKLESSSEEEEPEEESEEEDEDSDEMEYEEAEVDGDDDDDDEWETEDSNFIDDEAEEADSDEEEEEESDEDDHMVASSGSFLQNEKSKVKKAMEQYKKDMKEKLNESQQKKKKEGKSPKTPKSDAESPKQKSKKSQEAETPKADEEDDSVVKIPSTNGTVEGLKKKKKKKKKKKNKENAEDGNASLNDTAEVILSNSTGSPGKTKKRTIKGGIHLEDTKEGHGPEATQGKMVSVYYTGKLDGGKQFDSCMSGKPFKFKLGKGEVIKGWDSGIIGMKVGGKRKLSIPPAQGYGNQKQGPIPKNSTLHFEVELKAVS